MLPQSKVTTRGAELERVEPRYLKGWGEGKLRVAALEALRDPV